MGGACIMHGGYKKGIQNFGLPDGVRLLTRHRSNWEDNITMGLGEI
jgi:hypothetical protein